MNNKKYWLIGILTFVVALCCAKVDWEWSKYTPPPIKLPTHELAKLKVARITGDELSPFEKRYLSLLLPQHGATMSATGGEIHLMPRGMSSEGAGTIKYYCQVRYEEGNNVVSDKLSFTFIAGPSATDIQIDRDEAEEAIVALGQYFNPRSP